MTVIDMILQLADAVKYSVVEFQTVHCDEEDLGRLIEIFSLYCNHV